MLLGKAMPPRSHQQSCALTGRLFFLTCIKTVELTVLL